MTANLKTEIAENEKKWAGRNQFSALADELRAVGAEDEAVIADALAVKFPRADLVAYHGLQMQPTTSWKGFMFSKIRAVRDASVRPLMMKIHDIEESERMA